MRAEVFQWARGEDGCKADPALDKPKEAAAPVATPVPVKSKSRVARPKAGAAGGPAAATSGR
jgi:hypothetical protein